MAGTPPIPPSLKTSLIPIITAMLDTLVQEFMHKLCSVRGGVQLLQWPPYDHYVEQLKKRHIGPGMVCQLPFAKKVDGCVGWKDPISVNARNKTCVFFQWCNKCSAKMANEGPLNIQWCECKEHRVFLSCGCQQSNAENMFQWFVRVTETVHLQQAASWIAAGAGG